MSELILRAARRYIEAGMSVLPVYPIGHEREKRPALESWKHLQTNYPTDEEIHRWFVEGDYGLGLVTGPISHRITVLDIDNLELAKQILEEGSLIHGRRVVQTPSGGLHLYYRETGEKVGGNKQWPGLADIRGLGGFVVAPPTDGYTVISNGRIKAVENVQEYALDVIFPMFGFDAAHLEKQKKLELPDIISEGGRNDTLFRFAALMRGGGATQAEILAALRVVNRDRCQPPLDDEEVARISESASQYAENAKELPEKPTALDIGRALQSAHRIAVVGGPGGQLAMYRNGVYEMSEAKVRELAADLLAEKWTPVRVESTINWLRHTSETPRIEDRPDMERVNLRNGILDLKTRELLPHTSEYLSTVQLPVNYDPKAKCPIIDEFLRSALPEDLVPVFYEIAGWLMVPDVYRKTAVLLWGPTDTGKSTAIELLQAFLGDANYASVALQDLSTTFRPAELVGKLANFFDDLPNTTVRDSSIFKALTGRGVLTVERKYAQPYQVQPFARLVFAANEAPRTWDTSSAYFNRWLVIPFENQVPKSKQDKRLFEKMSQPAELSGFLNKAIAGLAKGRFTKARSSEEAAKRFREQADPVSTFLDEKIDYDHTARLSQPELYRLYQDWCQGHRRTPISAREFNEHLMTLDAWNDGRVIARRRQGKSLWIGLRRKSA